MVHRYIQTKVPCLKAVVDRKNDWALDLNQQFSIEAFNPGSAYRGTGLQTVNFLLIK